MIKFTLSMCVYAKENPRYLEACLLSIGKLKILPDEVVIVKDGPLTDELDDAIRDFRYRGDLKIIALPENVTSGPARAAGVDAASHEWIAIVDSDDICKPDRFGKQLEMIRNNPALGLIGGQISEFSNNPGHTISTRAVPCAHEDILRFAKIRNPFNQMTVMFKREAALAAGNYRFFPWFEDYDLWTRMISNGTICANHPDILVDARIGSGMYERRRGAGYISSEWRMQKQLKELGFTNGIEFMRNTAMRIPVRLLPNKLLAGVYGKIVRRKV